MTPAELTLVDKIAELEDLLVDAKFLITSLDDTIFRPSDIPDERIGKLFTQIDAALES